MYAVMVDIPGVLQGGPFRAYVGAVGPGMPVLPLMGWDETRRLMERNGGTLCVVTLCVHTARWGDAPFAMSGPSFRHGWVLMDMGGGNEPFWQVGWDEPDCWAWAVVGKGPRASWEGKVVA